MTALVQTLVQTVVNGLLLGGVLALLRSGLTLIFGVMQVVNFAHGEFVMLGMYAALLLTSLLHTDYPQLFAPLIFVVFVIGGGGVYWLTLRHVTGSRFAGVRGQDAQLIMTLGLSLLLQNLALMLAGSSPHMLTTGFSGAWSAGDILFNKPRTLGFAVAMIAIAGLLWFLRRSRAGRQLRATADDVQAAVYMGIDVVRAHTLAFSIGIGLAGVGGGILASIYPTQPYVGEDFIVLMFVAVVLGGLGSVVGALFGGLIIGLAQAFAPLFMPLELQNVVVFVIFLVILFVRPQGLFGRKARI